MYVHTLVAISFTSMFFIFLIAYSSYLLHKIPTAFQYNLEGSMAYFKFLIAKKYPLYIIIQSRKSINM